MTSWQSIEYDRESKNRQLMHCQFCKTTEGALTGGENFAVCEECAAGVRQLLGGEQGFENIIGFEPIEYDFSPDDGDMMYLEPREQFYAISVMVEDGSDMIYFDPIGSDSEKFPITEIREEIGEAIGNDEFYLVTINTDEISPGECWWESALAVAPKPGSEEEDDDPASLSIQVD